VLLDIEGTTTPVDFVYETLFPFARAQTRAFLEKRWVEPAVSELVSQLRIEHAADAAAAPAWSDDPPGVTRYVHWLMDLDRKSTGLKALQGRVWEEGYAQGALRGAVYEDVPRAFGRWRRQGRRLAIFSSGSVLAQKLIFGYSTAGDLTPQLEAFFDTTSGPKCEAESYRRIAGALGVVPAAVLFLSDVVAELDAARDAGMATFLSVRSGEAPATDHRAVSNFDALLP
jgi:enolase-phosphatase E1